MNFVVVFELILFINYTFNHGITLKDLIIMLFKSVTVKIVISMSLLKYISSILLSLKTIALSFAHKNSDLTTFLSIILFSFADLFLIITVTSSI